MSEELRDAQPEVPWSQIIAFRNVIVHEYFGIDLELVWEIVGEHIPTLRDQLNSVAASLAGG